MGVPKGKRKESRFEAQHHYYRLRSEVTNLMLLDFGFSEEKYIKSIERYREAHKDAPNVDEVVARYKKKCESFQKWFIDKECDAVLKILRHIESEFTAGNSIYPSETPAKIMKKLYKELFGKELIWKKQKLHSKTVQKSQRKLTVTAT